MSAGESSSSVVLHDKLGGGTINGHPVLNVYSPGEFTACPIKSVLANCLALNYARLNPSLSPSGPGAGPIAAPL